MHAKIIAAVWLASLVPAAAGSPPSPAEIPAPASLPNVDVSTGYFTYSDAMSLDKSDGELSISSFDFISVLSRPITVAGDIMLVPLVQYGLSSLDFDNVNTTFPIADEDLHSFSLHLAAVKTNPGSPWFYGAWVRAELASDFQQMTGDDVTFDIAGGVGYRVNNRFTIAAGAAVLNLNGDTWICPGLNFDWVVNDQLRIGLYGPMPMVSYTPSEDWYFSLRGIPGGGVWNITDANGDSKNIDITSYQVGAFASRRLTGKLWLNAGLGITMFNHLKLASPNGDHQIIDEDMQRGVFGQIGLSLKTW